MSVKGPTDITIIEEDEDEGGGQSQYEESYASILKSLGIDTKGLSVEDIRKVIHEYSQEGLMKGGDVIDFTTGKKRKAYKKTDNSRVYQVKSRNSEPLTGKEMDNERAHDDYNDSSEKQNRPAPSHPFSPKPKAP